MKRSVGGTYIGVEPFHLFRYVDEQASGSTIAKDMNDGDPFDLAGRQIVGKRLRWTGVTGKDGKKPESVN